MKRLRPSVHVRLALLLVVSIFAIAPLTTPAQGQEGSVCSQYAEKVLDTVGSICDALDRNTVCYGFNRVNATFAQAFEEGFFSRPADTASLADLQTLTTAPFNPQVNEWGVAVMNLQVAVPGTLPGQLVKFVLVGDIALENAVPPEQAMTELPPRIDVTVRTNANIRSGPGLNNNIVGNAVAGTVLQADGISPDREWFRVNNNESWAWMNRVVLTSPIIGEEQLVVIDGALQAPMQAFYFRTGIGDPACEDAPPNALVIQGPDDIVITLNVNGADIRLASTIMLTQPDASTMKLTTIDGLATMPGGNRVPGGFAMQTELDEQGLSDSQWTNYHPLTDEELREAAFLEMIAANALHYEIDVPNEADILATAMAQTPTPRPLPRATLPPPTLPPAPTVVSPQDIFAAIVANPQVVEPGGCTIVAWSARNVAEVYFEGAPQPLDGAVERCLRESTHFSIDVVNFDGSRFARSVLVEVAQPTEEPTSEPTEEPLVDCQQNPYDPQCQPPTPTPTDFPIIT